MFTITVLLKYNKKINAPIYYLKCNKIFKDLFDYKVEKFNKLLNKIYKQ